MEIPVEMQLENLQLADVNSAQRDIPEVSGESKVCPSNNVAETNTQGEVEATENISFNPPVYLQRYGMVQDVLRQLLEDQQNQDLQNGQTVMEVGCAEFGMHIFLKGNMNIGKIIYVDIDERLLMDRKHCLKPLPAEYLQMPTRAKPLVVEAYAGDITIVDTRLINETPPIWCVVAIELIEHLHLPDLRGFEISVFAVLKPEVVIVTTPNADFNSVFNLPPGKFRHWDHKWEWTRNEFQQWCQKICLEFNEYGFSVHGIGEGPEETRHLGCVSQMAVFKKVTPSQFVATNLGIVKENGYKLLESIVYPNYVETRTAEEIIISDIDYLMSHCWLSKRNIEHCMEENISEFVFPLEEVKKLLPSRIPGMLHLTSEYFRKVLLAANKYNIDLQNSEYVIRIPVPLWDQSPSNLSDLEDDATMENSMNEPNLPIHHNSMSSTDCDDDCWE